MPYEEWGRLLVERFPPREPETDQREWEALKKHLAVGQGVTGVVVAKAPFGAWLDIGAGFPALLLLPDIAGLTSESYQADDWCPVGSAIAAEVVLFNDRLRQVRVSQGRPHEGRARPDGEADRDC
jgi:ribosomal protein S1